MPVYVPCYRLPALPIVRHGRRKGNYNISSGQLILIRGDYFAKGRTPGEKDFTRDMRQRFDELIPDSGVLSTAKWLGGLIAYIKGIFSSGGNIC